MLDLILSLFQGFLLIKVGFLTINALYVVFLLIVFNQSRAMTRVINDSPASSIISLFALFNIIVGISIFVAALIIL